MKMFCLHCLRSFTTRRKILSHGRCPGCGAQARMLFMDKAEVDVAGILGALFHYHFGDPLPRKRKS